MSKKEGPIYLLRQPAYLGRRLIKAAPTQPFVLKGYNDGPSVNWEPLNEAAELKLKERYEYLIKRAEGKGNAVSANGWRAKLKRLKIVKPPPEEEEKIEAVAFSELNEQGSKRVAKRDADTSPFPA